MKLKHQLTISYAILLMTPPTIGLLGCIQGCTAITLNRQTFSMILGITATFLFTTLTMLFLKNTRLGQQILYNNLRKNIKEA